MITTNNHWYPILYFSDLTPKEQEEVLTMELEEEQIDYGFIRYHKSLYHISDFMKTNNPKWHGQHTISNCLAVLIQLSPRNEMYRIATCY